MPEQADRFFVRRLVGQNIAGEVKDIAQGGAERTMGAPFLPREGLVVFRVAYKAERDATAFGARQPAARGGFIDTIFDMTQGEADHFADLIRLLMGRGGIVTAQAEDQFVRVFVECDGDASGIDQSGFSVAETCPPVAPV